VHDRSTEMPIVGILATEQATPDFKEIIRDIDESVKGFKGIQTRV